MGFEQFECDICMKTFYDYDVFDDGDKDSYPYDFDSITNRGWGFYYADDEHLSNTERKSACFTCYKQQLTDKRNRYKDEDETPKRIEYKNKLKHANTFDDIYELQKLESEICNIVICKYEAHTPYEYYVVNEEWNVTGFNDYADAKKYSNDITYRLLDKLNPHFQATVFENKQKEYKKYDINIVIDMAKRAAENNKMRVAVNLLKQYSDLEIGITRNTLITLCQNKKLFRLLRWLLTKNQKILEFAIQLNVKELNDWIQKYITHLLT